MRKYPSLLWVLAAGLALSSSSALSAKEKSSNSGKNIQEKSKQQASLFPSPVILPRTDVSMEQISSSTTRTIEPNRSTEPLPLKVTPAQAPVEQIQQPEPVVSPKQTVEKQVRQKVEEAWSREAKEEGREAKKKRDKRGSFFRTGSGDSN